MTLPTTGEAFPAFVAACPTAAAPLGGKESLLVIQGGATKQVLSSALLSNGGLDAQTLAGFVGDGYTENGQSGTQGFKNLLNVLNISGAGGLAGKQNLTFLTSPITITAGNPTIVTLAGHSFSMNDPFIFTGTPGSTLPTGISFNTPYFVTAANLTKNTFTFSTVNNNYHPGPQSEGAPVATSGAASGTITVFRLNSDWVELVFPPGVYLVTSGVSGSWICGAKKLKVTGYGARFPNGFGIYTGGANSTTWSYVKTVRQGDNTLTTMTPAAAALFSVNQWICLTGIDLMSNNGFPPCARECQFLKITDIDTVGGVITFDATTTLKTNYRESWPQYGPHMDAGVGGSNTLSSCTGGPAVIFGYPAPWDCDVIYSGLRFDDDNNFQWVASAKTQTYIDCIFGGQGIYPSSTKRFHAIRCTWGADCEIDKLVEECIFEECTMHGTNLGNSSIQSAVFENCRVSIGATQRKQSVRNCHISTLQIGAYLGMTDACEIINCQVGTFKKATGCGMGNAGGAGGDMGWYTFANGILSLPAFLGLSGKVAGYGVLATFSSIAFPGNRLYFSSMFGPNTDNMGSPFIVFDTYRDASGNYCLDTSLKALPTGYQTSAQVTMTNVSGTVQINWAGHNLTAGTNVDFYGTEPGGMLHGAWSNISWLGGGNASFYVSSTNLTANSFELSTVSGGGGTPVAGITANDNTISVALATYSCSAAPSTPVLVAYFDGWENTGTNMVCLTAIPAGSNIVIAIYCDTFAIDISVGLLTDRAGNTYTLAVQPTITAGVQSCAIYHCLNSAHALNAGDTIKMSNLGTGISYTAEAFFFAGTGAVLDKTATQIITTPGQTTSINVTSGTLSAANEVVFAIWQSYHVYYGWNETSFTGWSNPGVQIALRTGSNAAFKVVSTTTAVPYTPSTSTYLLCVANALQLASHPCPKFTAYGNTGPVDLEDLNGAIDEPIYSRAKRIVAGYGMSGGNHTYGTKMYVWGTLDATTGITINVIQAFTGGGTATLTFNATGWTSNLAVNNLTAVIDLTQVGKRVITPTAATGALGADSIAAYTGWISSGISYTAGGSWESSSPKGTLNQQPIVEIDVRTDQGVHRYHGWQVADNTIGFTPGVGSMVPIGIAGSTVVTPVYEPPGW